MLPSPISATVTSPKFLHPPPPKPATFRTTAAAATFYDVLGIPAAASDDEIKAAYRRVAKSCHPDVAGANAPAAEFIRLHDAYVTLCDPEKRADYDRKMVIRSPERRFDGLSVLSKESTTVVCVPRKNWETDQCW